MPSGAKRRKSAKKKKATTSPPDQHQGWLRSHLHLLKAPSFGNGLKAKEVIQEEAKGQRNMEGDQKDLSQFKVAEVASEDGDDKVAAAQAPSMADQPNAELKASAEEFKEDASNNISTVKLQDAADEPKAPICVASSSEEVKVELNESASRDVNDSTELKVEKSSEETVTSPVEISGPVTEEVFDTSQAPATAEICASTSEKLMLDAAGFREAHDDDTSPRIEISRAAMVVRRASVWNCCGLLEVIRGNLFAFVLFASPIPTYRRILRNQSTEQFSGLPYLYSLLNCLICLWYGLPCVSYGVVLVATVNSIGAVFQLVYISLFIAYADNARRLKMCGMLIGVLTLFGLIVYVSLVMFDHQTRRTFVGYLSVASLISMFASPLFIMVGSLNSIFRLSSVSTGSPMGLDQSWGSYSFCCMLTTARDQEKSALFHY
ncbi:Bidirectional sugar transporter SWEET2a [Apostasia shenzhenica]|uniref:Bidirectional sugar transporter SWEET2a n=1 Tax=Apostasia shenzhenica TaxID=1088818 RepID=A0A2I0B0Z5_9ASPA|nr:Bidirectional sugar transporter SWEET2a [Apostasia shenzhenica]